MDSLPSDTKRRVATFLVPDDAIHWSLTCKRIHSDLSISRLQPTTSLGSYSWRVQTDTPQRGPVLPLVLPSSEVTHSITIRMNWKDQGWGNRKGRLYIVAHNEKEEKEGNTKIEQNHEREREREHARAGADWTLAFRDHGRNNGDLLQRIGMRVFDMRLPVFRANAVLALNGQVENEQDDDDDDNDDNDDDETEGSDGDDDEENNSKPLFDGGSVVYMTPEDAPHEAESLEIIFVPQPHKVYHLWYKVGSGGGHNLFASNIQCCQTVWDDSSHARQRVHRSLARLGFFTNPQSPMTKAFMSLLVKVMRSPGSDDVRAFLTKHGLDVSPSMLSALKEYESIFEGK